MVFAPIFGYLGDRFPRKYVISFGICIWSAMTLSGSYMDDKVIKIIIYQKPLSDFQMGCHCMVFFCVITLSYQFHFFVFSKLFGSLF